MVLTMLVAASVGILIYFLDQGYLSAIGSILSGVGSLLAVIWFSAGLYYQSKQLNEQRAQFASQFKHLQEASRRDALVLVKEILEKSKQNAITYNGGVKNLNELIPQYTNFVELKPILESDDPREVLNAFEIWIKKEGAALLLLNGIKTAAEIYFKSVGYIDIDYSKNPEDFYYTYSYRFDSQPFFNEISGVAGILSEFMVRLTPARNAARIASFAANVKTIGEKLFKMEKLREDIKNHLAKGYPLPAIANYL